MLMLFKQLDLWVFISSIKFMMAYEKVVLCSCYIWLKKKFSPQLRGEKQLIEQILQTEINLLGSIRDGTALMQHMEDFYYITLLEVFLPIFSLMLDDFNYDFEWSNWDNALCAFFRTVKSILLLVNYWISSHLLIVIVSNLSTSLVWMREKCPLDWII